MTRDPAQVPPGSPLPPPLDQSSWDEAATEYAIQSVERLRESAEKWVGTISTLVGLFGTVVVIGGPDALTEITPAGRRYGVFAALSVAAVLAGFAIILGALAAQSSTRLWDNWNGATFAAYVAHNGSVAARKLAASRWLGASAAALVLGAGLFATWSGLDPDEGESDANVLLVAEDGTALCGTLTSVDGELRVDGRPVVGVEQAIVVPSC
jgi:hypothetical protein